MNETERNEAKYSPTAKVVFSCGCGSRFVSEAVSNTPEILAAWRHAETTGHSLTIHGEVRVERGYARVRSAYQPSQGVAQ